MNPDKCPICLDAHVTGSSVEQIADRFQVSCECCGTFDLKIDGWSKFLNHTSEIGRELTPVQRSRISHKLKTTPAGSITAWPQIALDFLNRFKKDGFPGPNPAGQVVNLIRYVGDKLSERGELIETAPDSLYSIIGSPNPSFVRDLILGLTKTGLMVCENLPEDVLKYPADLNLTLAGWEKYELEKSGKYFGKTGFIAMQFNVPELDALVQKTMKPFIKSEIGYDLVDLRGVARAGVIDNIMRAQIRDSAFVLVDLTHDNFGAYWEAGYAEGLGKPVIYLCEKIKFDEHKTHFDTNHLTTVVWDSSEIEKFKADLIATLRNSLNLFR